MAAPEARSLLPEGPHSSRGRPGEGVPPQDAWGRRLMLGAAVCFATSLALFVYAQVQHPSFAIPPMVRGAARNLEVPGVGLPKGDADAKSRPSAVAATTAPLSTTASPGTTTATTTTTVATNTATTTPAACANARGSCAASRCCAAPGAQCYEKNRTAAFCKPGCRPGPDMTDREYSSWTCKELGARTPGRQKPTDWTSRPVPEWAQQHCSPGGASCLETKCCSSEGAQCYKKNATLALCKPSCTQGPDYGDVDPGSWSCEKVGPRTPGKISLVDLTALPMPEWADSACAGSGENCSAQQCCSEPGRRCFRKNAEWAACRPACVPGPQPDDRADAAWTCKPHGPMSPGAAEVPVIRRGTFIVIGDWGWDEKTSGTNQDCRNLIAREMDKKMTELGDVKFVISLGDSFNSGGVSAKDDPKWNTTWRWVYSMQLRSVAWYSVYGDHDYRKDPCACTANDEECAQTNYDKDNFEFFQMPGTSYSHSYPELGVELVGLDLNNFQNAAKSEGDAMFEDCFKTACAFMCLESMKKRTQAGLDLFYERAKRSKQKSLVVFSHYPTDHFEGAPEFLDALRDNSTHDITYFGAHRQATDQSGISITPNTNWVVGGGGGASCDKKTSKQGFAVGEIWGDSSVTVTPVYVDSETCCG